MNTRKIAALAALALTLAVSACVSTAAGGASGGSQDELTREQIASVNVSTLYDVVQRLRPRWLEVRAQQSFNTQTQVVVYQNQTLLGGVDVLRQLAPEMAYSMEYLDGPTAAASLPGLGSRQVEGAIVIHTSASS